MMDKLILMQTTSDYPTCNEQVNLRVLQEYGKRYKVITGFSDHTTDYTASIGAVALGARVLEKHFTLSRRLSGPDQSTSLEPTELKEWTTKIRIIEKSMGSEKKLVTISEKKNLSMRKILVIKPAKKETKITKDLLAAMRGKMSGILPLKKNIKSILGKKLAKNILQTSQFSWNMIK
jgi:sialic acid synthase SpsE